MKKKTEPLESLEWIIIMSFVSIIMLYLGVEFTTIMVAMFFYPFFKELCDNLEGGSRE